MEQHEKAIKSCTEHENYGQALDERLKVKHDERKAKRFSCYKQKNDGSEDCMNLNEYYHVNRRMSKEDLHRRDFYL